MTFEQAGALIEKVRSKFGEAVFEWSAERGEASITVESSMWPKVAGWLNSEAGFSFLSDLCGLDWPEREQRFEVIYTLTDMDSPAQLRVKVALPAKEPRIASVTSIWPAANWLEREAFDMFGIAFEGHSDLRRILMPDEWEGYPLRKDYAMGKVPVEYKHLSPGY